MKLLSVIFFAAFITLTASYTRVIIVEEAKACFRRVLAGKRVSRSYVKRTLFCERIEDCQQECARERKFVCEGFNYRLDPTGRPQGECELVDLPLSRMDFSLDLFRDPDVDYYERDRDSMPDCRPRVYYPLPPPKDVIHLDIRPHAEDRYDRGQSSRRGDTSYDAFHAEKSHQGGRLVPPGGHHYPPGRSPQFHTPPYLPRRPTPYLDHKSSESHSDKRIISKGSYYYDDRRYHSDRDRDRYYPDRDRLPPQPDRFNIGYDDRKRPSYFDDEKERDYWGLHRRGYGTYGGLYGNFGKPNVHYNYKHSSWSDRSYTSNHHSTHYLPIREPQPTYQTSIVRIPDYNKPCQHPCSYTKGDDWRYGGTKDWGRYGGSYGNGGGKFLYVGYKDSNDYWGLDRNGGGYRGDGDYVGPTPFRGRPTHVNSFQPVIGGGSQSFSSGGSSIGSSATHVSSSSDSFGNSNKRVGGRYNLLKDECSLRTATGFRLSKNTVRKFLSVQSIYECELQCVKERDFICNSYAYRYTITLSKPTDNCYLSDRSYKALDFYTDLEPDRDFDIYTMNNPFRCEVPVIRAIDHSDCFWRVRSGQRLDSHIVKDTMNVKNIVECQIECLKAFRFTCRAFSYRFGPPIIGGVIDNCQLTDWPFLEMDPIVHMRPEPGFEIYDRGSFGHGCEPDHFAIRGKKPVETGAKTDQLCYVGYGTPARLLPSAIRKAVYVDSEFDCKQECSKARSSTLLQCMSFSYRHNAPKGVPNCELSDILQRDLLLDLDYTSDTHSWLFAWDNYNPDCVSIAFGSSSSSSDSDKDSATTTITITQEGRIEYESFYPLDIWRVYSVSGWPCKRGTLCRENKEAGFWFCELEGGGAGVWDYCCRPTHQCGYSLGYSYQWCYVGPVRTQWRKCSDRYYPYLHHFIDRNDNIPPEYHSYLPDNSDRNPWPQEPPVQSSLEPPFRPGFRPERPAAKPTRRPQRPSLDEYEDKFDHQFLEPPKPGGLGTPQGFGQPRHWPVSYLHKEIPPNETVAMEPPMPGMAQDFKLDDKQKFQAIQNLIDIIKSNDLNNIKYQITNHSDKVDDVLYVKIPLPTNGPNSTTSTTESTKRKTEKPQKMTESANLVSLEPIDIFSPINFTTGTNDTQKYRNSREQSTHNFFTTNPSGLAADSFGNQKTQDKSFTPIGDFLPSTFSTKIDNPKFLTTNPGHTTKFSKPNVGFEHTTFHRSNPNLDNEKVTSNPYEKRITVNENRPNPFEAKFGKGRNPFENNDDGFGMTDTLPSTFEAIDVDTENPFETKNHKQFERRNFEKSNPTEKPNTFLNSKPTQKTNPFENKPNPFLKTNPFDKPNPFLKADPTGFDKPNPFLKSDPTGFDKPNPFLKEGSRNPFETTKPTAFDKPNPFLKTSPSISNPFEPTKPTGFDRPNPFLKTDKPNPFEKPSGFGDMNPFHTTSPSGMHPFYKNNFESTTFHTINPTESPFDFSRRSFELTDKRHSKQVGLTEATTPLDHTFRRSEEVSKLTTTLKPPPNYSSSTDLTPPSISKRVDAEGSTSTNTPPLFRKAHIVKTNVTNYGRRRDRQLEYRFLV